MPQPTLGQYLEHYVVVLLIWFGLAEFVCRVLNLPYSPLGWLFRTSFRGAIRLLAWTARTIITAIVEGIRGGVRRRAPP